jgi:uncharacterized protein
LTQYFKEYCSKKHIRFDAAMTTNGSLLTQDLIEQLIPYGLTHFQITLDGVEDEHDKRRVPIDGKPSFDRILENLRYLKGTTHQFTVHLRHNFDVSNLQRLEDYLAMIRLEFGRDYRFRTTFEPIGMWGGPNDQALAICEGKTLNQSLVRAWRLAVEAGFRNGLLLESLRPNGFVCYAANPRSFVVGSDGSIYKCTVELDYHERNVVGRLYADGNMELDWQKMSLWCETNGMQEGVKCSSCFFSPNCYGSVCPKEWMDSSDVTCPPQKIEIGKALQVIQLEDEVFQNLDQTIAPVAQCTRG